MTCDKCGEDCGFVVEVHVEKPTGRLPRTTEEWCPTCLVGAAEGDNV